MRKDWIAEERDRLIPLLTNAERCVRDPESFDRFSHWQIYRQLQDAIDRWKHLKIERT